MKAWGATLALVVLSATTASAASTIRVALTENVRTAELRGFDIDVAELGGCERCPRTVRRMSLVRASVVNGSIEIDGRRAPAFRLTSDRPLRFNGRDYSVTPPGALDLIRNGDGLALVNEVPFEDYLVGVVRAESSEKWPLEALRAQAIAARTYAAYHRLLSAAKPYHIVASTAHQQYFGRVPAASPIWGAVRETAGQVLRWEGDVFPAFYHTESGGYTEDPRTVFAARNMPGLKPVRCEFSAGSPHFYWSLDLRLTELSETLRRHDVSVGSVTSIDVTERTPSLRAATITVHGARGSARLLGNDFRRMIGYDRFKSTLFAVAVDGDWARFSGRGYGHGVGMCQWGAKGMAEAGYTARQILDFYYPGTTAGVLNERGQ
jgi:stage II sporulation protein D (peptidoglycan lytic transglycosylase)